MTPDECLELFRKLDYHKDMGGADLFNDIKPYHVFLLFNLVKSHAEKIGVNTAEIKQLQGLLRECENVAIAGEDRDFDGTRNALSQIAVIADYEASANCVSDPLGCGGCIHRDYVKAHPYGTSSNGWRCLKSGGHAIERCDGYEMSPQRSTDGKGT